jgi:hypothetical protein
MIRQRREDEGSSREFFILHSAFFIRSRFGSVYVVAARAFERPEVGEEEG